jgi:hypothetical protein
MLTASARGSISAGARFPVTPSDPAKPRPSSDVQSFKLLRWGQASAGLMLRLTMWWAVSALALPLRGEFG